MSAKRRHLVMLVVLLAVQPAVGSGGDYLALSGLLRGRPIDTVGDAAIVSSRPGKTDDGPSWSLRRQPDGVWAFRQDAGTSSLAYEPTAPRQSIDDGRWHHIAIIVDATRKQTRFFFDGVGVAVYSDALTLPATTEHEVFPEAAGVELRDLRVSARRSTPETLLEEASLIDRRPASSARAGETIRVMAWNIWHGGREDGEVQGVDRVIEAIRESNADVICMQETYGSGPKIADALGFVLFLRSSNLSVMSRFPIEEVFDLHEPFRFGACRVRLRPDRSVIVCPLWIHHLPDWWGEDRPNPGCDVARILAAENETRGREIREILAELRPFADRADVEPVIVAGDFNSMSHLDWSAPYAHVWNGEVIEWPVSKRMTEAGFVDAYRLVHPDVSLHPGRTWSPRFPEVLQTRIDYVYVKGRSLTPITARMLDRLEPRWPSDHAAVLVELRLHVDAQPDS